MTDFPLEGDEYPHSDSYVIYMRDHPEVISFISIYSLETNFYRLYIV